MSDDKLDDAIAALVDIEKSLAGIVEAYQYMPEAVSAFPSFVNYAPSGRDRREEASTIRGLYTLGAELHVSRGILPEGDRIARPYIQLFTTAVFNDPTLNGTVDTVLEVRWRTVPVVYNTEIHLCVRFEIDLKLRRAAAI